jgi:hypothetical protein
MCEECGALGFFAENYDPDIECPRHRGCSVFTVMRSLDARMRADREQMARLKKRHGIDSGGLEALEKYLGEVFGVQLVVKGFFPGYLLAPTSPKLVHTTSIAFAPSPNPFN